VSILLLLIVLVLLLIPYIIFLLIIGTAGRNISLSKNYGYKPTVTVFVPTYNEEKFIEKKLKDLLNQSYPITEILIYDCSTDNTPSIVADYQRRFPIIKLIRQTSRIGMAMTLNQAFKDATGEIFVKTDCDSISNSTANIKELIANFSDKQIGGATGICVSKLSIEKFFRKFMTSIQIAETNIDSTIIAHSASLVAFRTTLVEQVNFNSMADDTEEFVLIRKKGYRTVVDRSVISEEDVPLKFSSRRAQKDRRAQGIIKVIFENHDMLFNRKYGKFGFIVLPLELFILVVSPFLLISSALVISAILYFIHPVLIIAMFFITVAAFIKKVDIFSAIVDTQLSGLTGSLKSLLKRHNALWEKVR
jgi:cellulose synthase/poly-beta-1,6-N-acetylglucosamine synthase-like glycosyltransferase